MINIDIHWPSLMAYKNSESYQRNDITLEFIMIRVLERLKSLHGQFIVHDIYFGRLNNELYEDFRSACDKQSVRIQSENSSNSSVDKIFYYVSYFSIGLDEKLMRNEVSGYTFANMKQIAQANSISYNCILRTDDGNLELEVKTFSPSDYKSRYIINPFSLGRYDAFYMINDAGINTTSPLRRYSSAFEPHYSSFSPLGGLYVFYNCCTENISTIGHRFSDQYFYDLLSNRDDYYVIAVFGGSAAYSIFCSDSEQFGAKISQNLSGKGIDCKNKKIVMINFSLPGSTIFEARLYFTMEASKIKPDLCILHFGWNESRLGPNSHPSMAKLGIYFNHSSYSNLLTSNNVAKGHVTEDNSTLPDFPSIPHTAFISYLYQSIIDFNEMIERYESKLIIGLQPIIHSQRHYHNRLHYIFAWKESFLYNTKYQDTLYQMLPDMLAQNKDLNFLNVDSLLYQLEDRNKDGDDFIFMDACHLNGRGDALVAEIYTQFILSNIFG